MKISVVYSNPKGNTKLLADSVADTLSRENIYYFGEPAEQALDADVIYLGFWTDKGTADDVATAFLKQVANKKIFLFGSAGFGGDPNYFKKILSSTKESCDKSNTIIGEFMCQGKMKMAVKERYLSMKASGTAPSNIDMLIENFDKALSHPDNDDLENLKHLLLK